MAIGPTTESRATKKSRAGIKPVRSVVVSPPSKALASTAMKRSIQTGVGLSALVDAFDTTNEVRGLSSASREFYRDAGRQLIAYLGERYGFVDPDSDELTVEVLEGFLAHRRRTA